jgi:hypothetical protein
MNFRTGRLLGLAAIPSLALAGMLLTAPAASASATPTLISAASTRVCAGGSSWCSGIIAQIPANAQLQVICSRNSDYYVEDLANRALEGYVAKSNVRNPPGGLADCDTTHHPAFFAAANALGYYGSGDFGGLCLTFVIDMWKGTGVPNIPGSDDPVTWWPAYHGKLGYAWDTSGPRFATPPRGALVFWYGTPNYPEQDSEDGHVAISLGDGWVISTETGNTASTDKVHIALISTITSEAGGHGSGPGSGKEIGWVMPIPGYQIQQ